MDAADGHWHMMDEYLVGWNHKGMQSDEHMIFHQPHS
jgi:hypothetical protein